MRRRRKPLNRRGRTDCPIAGSRSIRASISWTSSSRAFGASGLSLSQAGAALWGQLLLGSRHILWPSKLSQHLLRRDSLAGIKLGNRLLDFVLHVGCKPEFAVLLDDVDLDLCAVRRRIAFDDDLPVDEFA